MSINESSIKKEKKMTVNESLTKAERLFLDSHKEFSRVMIQLGQGKSVGQSFSTQRSADDSFNDARHRKIARHYLDKMKKALQYIPDEEAPKYKKLFKQSIKRGDIQWEMAWDLEETNIKKMKGRKLDINEGSTKKTSNVIDIINGISSAARAAYDGAVDDKGEKVKVGLNREKYDSIVFDSRGGAMDGFNVKFGGEMLTISYHGEVNMKDLHKNGPKKFEREIESMFGDIVKFLKKEYKKHAKGSLTLTSQGDCEAHIQRMSNIRNWVQATKVYKIGNLGGVMDTDKPGTVDKAIKSFLDQSTDKRPKNAKVKND
tara:strand:+ start:974 stop:1921 length:948 start_codon:yes stop_codon:yes gene_type:complete